MNSSFARLQNSMTSKPTKLNLIIGTNRIILYSKVNKLLIKCGGNSKINSKLGHILQMALESNGITPGSYTVPLVICVQQVA